jgi:hypothetical protein
MQPPGLVEDGERSFARGWCLDADGQRKPVLAVSPTAEHPTPSNLERLAHEFGLKDELDDAWAVRPLELLRNSQGTMLLLEDPGGEPLARRLGTPWRWDSSCAWRSASSERWARRISMASCTRTQANQYPGHGRGCRGAAHWLRSRLAPTARAVVTRAAGRAHWNSCLHVPRTDRPHEPVDRLRSDLYALGVTFVPDADRRAAVYGGRSDGSGCIATSHGNRSRRPSE